MPRSFNYIQGLKTGAALKQFYRLYKEFNQRTQQIPTIGPPTLPGITCNTDTRTDTNF